MNDDTKAKFAKLFAEQQAKANAKKLVTSKAMPALPTTKPEEVKPTPAPAVTPQPKPVFNPPATNKTSINTAIDRIKQNNVFTDDDINLKAIPATPAPELSKLQSFCITAHEGEELNIEGKIFTTWQEANNAIKLICDQYTGPGYYKTYIFVQWENGRNLSDRIDVQDRKGDFWAYTENIGDYLANHYNSLTTVLSFKDDPTEATAPELSSITFADLMNTAPEVTPAVKPQEPAPAPAKLEIEIKEYSALSFVVRGKGTYQIKDQLRAKGGAFNRFLTGGPGWIFASKKYYTIKSFIDRQQTA